MSTKKCFVIMSFKPDLDNVYHIGIRKAVEEAGYQCVRVDESPKPSNIPFRIVSDIIAADIVIADLSDPRPNVFYELGISHSVGNKTISITQDVNNLPFDVRNEYTLPYENTREGIRLLYFELLSVIRKISDDRDRPNNLVQVAGREFFDLRNQIRENLRQIRDERERLHAFERFATSGTRTDNDLQIRDIAERVLERRHLNRPTLVAISGAAGLGKTSLSLRLKAMVETMGVSCSVLPLDSFMLDRAERLSRNLSGYDPRANDLLAISHSIRRLQDGESVDYRPYDHATGEHAPNEQECASANVIILDGNHSLHPRSLPHLDYKVFLYARRPIARELRFLTDIFERGYSAQTAFQHVEDEYKNFQEFVLEYARFADIVVEIEPYWHFASIKRIGADALSASQ